MSNEQPKPVARFQPAERIKSIFTTRQLESLIARSLLEADMQRATALENGGQSDLRLINAFHFKASQMQTEVILRSIFA